MSTESSAGAASSRSTVPEHVLVVGAGLGGVRTVEGLRSAGYEGRISLVGGEVHLPYDRPPLSKQLLAGTWERERIDLTAEEKLADLGVRTRLGLRAVALRPGEVELSDGATLHADAIVLAPGVTSRVLEGQPDSVHMLRDVDESLALRATLDKGGSLLVVGAGFIGAEVASTAHDLGVDVTVVEAAPVPMARVLGEQVGALAARLIDESGVRLRCGVAITALTGDGATLADGTTISADAVVVGVGGSWTWAGSPAPGSTSPAASRATSTDGCRGSTASGPSATPPPGPTVATATGPGTSTGPRRPTRPPWWPATSPGPSRPRRRCPTSGPTSSGSRSS
ncbi:NAD(P)/FAD-dependent oxidoreductase [Pseudonocardia sp. KRD291]|uniref:NAD(P)/FAD-dependent oxidoreductase n=1 Tax=Pseudonocardia sp. KRD291 TaxID=2792007 RepID=UPI001CF7AFAE|nr:FAD-dependent oxidoreductase [Pseudonocardia sp. KRD291]